jgi:hypothetical protein
MSVIVTRKLGEKVWLSVVESVCDVGHHEVGFPVPVDVEAIVAPQSAKSYGEV